MYLCKGCDTCIYNHHTNTHSFCDFDLGVTYSPTANLMCIYHIKIIGLKPLNTLHMFKYLIDIKRSDRQSKCNPSTITRDKIHAFHNRMLRSRIIVSPLGTFSYSQILSITVGWAAARRVWPISLLTSTVYWCIASKLKAPWNFYWMSNMFLWVEIFLFFVCYHVVPKRHSQLDYELNGL